MKSQLYSLDFKPAKGLCIYCTKCGKYFELSDWYFTMIAEDYLQFPICYGCADERIKNHVKVNKIEG